MKKGNVILADLTDIVFEGRNKHYGGYVIRKEQNKNLLIGGLLTTTVFALLLLIPFLTKDSNSIIPKIKHEVIHFLAPVSETVLPKTEVTPPEPEHLPPANTEPAPAAASSELLNPNPVRDDLVDDNTTMQEQDSILHNPGTENREGNEDGNPMNTEDGTGIGIAGTDTTTTILEPGLNDFHIGTEPAPLNMDKIRRQIRFPEVMIEMGTPGKATFRVLVDENGKYVKHVCIHKSHKLFEKACEKHLKKLEFKPGMQGDHPVKVWVNIPFIFKLPN